jgi:large subunit ribosomal protein L25
MMVKLRQSVAITLQHAVDIDGGGVLQHVLNEIEVEALPANLPSEIIVDISGLTSVGDALHVRDIVAPADVEIMSDPDLTVASVIHQVSEAEEEGAEEAAAEGEEAAEGETAEGGEEESSSED